jgi:hypothetical protein
MKGLLTEEEDSSRVREFNPPNARLATGLGISLDVTEY